MVGIRIQFDRIIAKGKVWIVIVVILGILILPLLFFIFSDYIIQTLSEKSIWNDDQMNHILDSYESYLNPNFDSESPNPERGYRLLIAYIGAFLLNGLLVSFVVSWIQSRREKWERGELHYKRWDLGKYCIVIGGNEMVPNLVHQLLDNNDYVLVMTNRDVPSLRKKMTSRLGDEEKKVIIYVGERTSEEDLELLQIMGANEIYVIGEQLDINQSGSHHDVKNMECVQTMASLLRKHGYKSKKMCRVLFEYQSSFSVFQFTDINTDISEVLEFRPFNYYETWAQNVLVCQHINMADEGIKYLPLEGKNPISINSNETVHLIIVGMSRMGIALAIEAAHVAHYPNFIRKDGNKLRTRITFIDSIARKEMQFFQGHYKELFALSRWRYMEATNDSIYYNEKGHLPYDVNDSSWKDPLCDENSHSPYRDSEGYTLGEKLVDVDWEFIQGDLEMPTVQCYIRDATFQKDVKLTIAICIPRDNATFAASLYLPDEVYEEKNNVVQVLAYQPYGDAMCNSFQKRIEMRNSGNVRTNNFNQFAKLRAFGMMDSCFDIANLRNMEKIAEQLWKQYEETYRDQIGGRQQLREIIKKEKTLKAGKSLAARQWSNTYAAAHLWTKLRSVVWDGKDLSEKDLKILAEVEHIRWNMEQLLLGYAPLRPQEQKLINEKFQKAMRVPYPYDELQLLQESKGNPIGEENSDKLIVWLDLWKEFDEEKEYLKAEMSHIDICSFEILNQIDKEAIKYDENLTRILPNIYKSLKKVISCEE